MKDVWRRRTLIEVATRAPDVQFDGIGSDSFGSRAGTPIRLPATPPISGDPFCCILASKSFLDGQKFRVLDAAQMLLIGASMVSGAGADASNYRVEREVVTPTWHFKDGWVSWHLIRVRPNDYGPAPAGAPRDGFVFRFQNAPGIAYETLPTDAGGYTAPFGRRLPDCSALAGGAEFFNFHDIRFPWHRFCCEGIGVWDEGPCTVALVAFVMQTANASDSPVTLPTIPAPALPFVAVEDAFVQTMNAGSARPFYSGIAGRLIFEVEIKDDARSICQTTPSDGGGDPPLPHPPHHEPPPPNPNPEPAPAPPPAPKPST